MTDMTIKELRNRRIRLCEDITSLLCRFREDTDVPILGVDVDMLDLTEIGGKKDTTVGGVHIELAI